MLHDTPSAAQSSRLIIDEHPLQVLPSLAVAIGLNEAIFIQQVHYWIKTSKHQRDGRSWIYNTLEDWRKQFPFWSMSTVRRIIEALKSSGVLITSNYNDTAVNRTLWYTIDYDVLNGFPPSAEPGTSSAKSDTSFVQNGQMGSKASAETNISSAENDTPCVQPEHAHVSNLDTSTAQSGHMLIEQRLTPETTQTPPPPPRARGDVELRGGGGGNEFMEIDDVGEDVGSDVEESQADEAETENVKRDLMDALAALGIRPEMAYKTVMAGTVSSDQHVILCKRFLDSSTAKTPAAVLWSQYLSIGRLPPAPYSETSTVTAGQLAAARRMREESDRRAEAPGPVVGLKGLSAVLAGSALRSMPPAMRMR